MSNPNNMVEGKVYNIDELINDNSKSKSFRIRKLYEYGFEKASIALMMGCRYQMVREILLKTLVQK